MQLSEHSVAETHAPRVALVTGATGFVGRHLLDVLGRTAWSVVGLARRGPVSPDPKDVPKDVGGTGGTWRHHVLLADLREPARVERALEEVAPDYVFHLAGATPPSPDSRILDLNVFASTMLFEVVARQCPEARVLVVGSDAQYGQPGAGGRPVPESTAMRPEGTYGRSKVLQEAVALRYADMAGLHVVCVRPFPVVGPGQSTRYTVGRMVHRIARAEADRSPTMIQTGHTGAASDLTDVRDVARAFLHAILEGVPAGIYNVGSGVATSLDEVARTLASMAGTPVTLQAARHHLDGPGTDAGETVLCDASRLRAATGWAPEISMEQSLADALDHARRAMGSEQLGSPPEQGAAE